MKTKLLTIGLLLFCLFTFSVEAQTTEPANGSSPSLNEQPVPAELPEITFEEERHNFGQINQGESAAHTFKFTNTGKIPVKLETVRASCGCTSPKWPKDEIQPGESGVIDVVFNSRGKRGAQLKSVTVQYGGAKPAIVYMQGEVLVPTPDAPAPVKKAPDSTN